MENLLRPEDVAELAGVDVGTVHRWSARGEGPPVLCIGRGGRLRRFERRAVVAWLGARPARMPVRAPGPASDAVEGASSVEGAPSAAPSSAVARADVVSSRGKGRDRACFAHLREPEATALAAPGPPTNTEVGGAPGDAEPSRELDTDAGEGELDARTHERDATHAMTLQQVGEQLGMTRERVRQIERRALTKVRCALAIEERLGASAAPILEGLRGKPLRQFQAAAHSAESE